MDCRGATGLRSAAADWGRRASLECLSGGQAADEARQYGSAGLEVGWVDGRLDGGVQLVFDLTQPGK